MTLSTPVDQKKYFGTDGIRGRVGVWPITPDFILKLGWAFGRVLAEKESGGKVLIGKDTRISGYMFESALEAGLSAAGIDIHLLGPMPTPATAYLTRTLRARAGIVISASHNPYYDNGIKFFSAEGHKLPDDIELAIEAQLKETMTTVDSARLGKAVRIVDAPGRYIEFCKATVPSTVSLSGLRIVVDCANGAAYHIAPAVFAELGAEVIELGTQPDGLNINLECGATHVRRLREYVLQKGADLGVAVDGDADRVIMVDSQGDIVDGDDILYIIARQKAESGSLTGGVVGTVMSNLGLEQAIREMGVDFVRVPVGDRHVVAELQQRGWQMGGEPSGHIMCSDAVTTGDGIVTALQVLCAMQHYQLSLFQLKKGMRRYPQISINLRVGEDDVPDFTSPSIKAAVKDAESRMAPAGRVLLRRSGTEPVIRIMVEGQDEDTVRHTANWLAGVVKEELILCP